MKIDTKQIFAISDANQNFSRVVKTVDEKGEVVILKNNKPKYVIKPFNENEFTLTDAEKIEIIARRILKEHKYAFDVLAK